jgi:hypothetical protein
MGYWNSNILYKITKDNKMKIDKEALEYIRNVVQTAQIVNIDSVIIEPDHVRAIDDDKTVVLFQSEDVPAMEFGSIGLNRINVFLSRLDIAKTQDNFSIETITDSQNEYVRSLTMKGKGVKIDYRCANPTKIGAPRRLIDEMQTQVQLNPEAVMLMQKGLSAMGGAERVKIVCDGEVSFEIVDVNSDVFKHTFADHADPIGDNDDVSFSHLYPLKTLLALFKQAPNNQFKIGKKGILNIEVNGLNLYVLPQV